MMKHVRRDGALWVSVCLALSQIALVLPLQSCTGNDGSDGASHPVRYVLEWKRSKVRDLAPQEGWEVVNDLGFTVRVTRAYLVSRSIELVPCTPQAPKLSLRDAWDELIGPRPAFAGHSTVADPSASTSAQVESLQRADTSRLPALYPGAQRYCHAHYLIARADTQATGLPADVDMVDQTLRFDGEFQRPGATTFEPFTVRTAVANGKLVVFGNLTDGALDTGRNAAVVIIRRNLDTVFDRVDFSTMNEKRIAREILQNLIDGVEIDVRHG
jgi:hypothetical protein